MLPLVNDRFIFICRMDPSAYQLFHAEAYYHGEIPYPPPPLRKLTFSGRDDNVDEAEEWKRRWNPGKQRMVLDGATEGEILA